MTTTIADRARSVCRKAFITTLLLFLGLATALVATQTVGVLFMRSQWITWASDVLLVPSITAAVAVGLVGFIGGYVMPEKADPGE